MRGPDTEDPAEDRLLDAFDLRLQAAVPEEETVADWHPLLTGDPNSTHKAGQSIKGITLSETEIPEDDWEDYLIEETP
jgi:uncharacterized cysteine cluster protein YcgN (CxxCxxCC family)